jgi:inward rectifier potassium channel
MTPYKNTNLTDAEAKITLGMKVEESGISVNKFFSLELELEKVNSLTMSWTLVHPISESSPLYHFSQADYQNLEGEILVFMRMFDDMYSTTVAKRTSYIFSEIVYGAKFTPMFSRNEDESKSLLHIDKLNDYEMVVLE